MLWLSLALFGSVAITVWRTEAVLDKHLPAWFARYDTPAPTNADVRPALPPDLESLVVQEQEQWAQDQMRTLLQDEFTARGDWDAVRAAHMGALG